VQAHVLVGEAAGLILVELGVHIGMAGKPRTAQWGPSGTVGSLEMHGWEEGWQQKVRGRAGSISVEANLTVRHGMDHH